MAEIIYKAYVSIRKKPKNFNDTKTAVFEEAFSVEIGVTDLLRLRNVMILRERIFSFRRWRFYHRYSNILPVSRKELISSFRLLLKPYKKIDKAIWITHEWSSAYFHWLTDALTRLIAVKELSEGYAVILPSYYKEMKYIQESLDILGVKTYYYEPQRRLLVKKLLVPGFTALPTGNYNREIIHKLRDQLAVASPTAPDRKIYISRQKADKRKVLNEEAVIDLMKQYNYEVHFFEDYSFSEQINLMSQVKTLAGIHGAGLTNMLFMKSGGNILELRRKNDRFNNCFFSLASELEHDYYFLENEGTSENTQTSDITVDMEQLKKVLDKVEKSV